LIDPVDLALVPWEQLAGCRTLDLRNNPCLVTIPTSLRNLPSTVTEVLFSPQHMRGLDQLYASAGSAEQILRYLNLLQRSESLLFPELKLLVVGRAAVGKTTLVRRLRGDSFEPILLSTDGIDLGRFRVQDFSFVSFDFGGQKCMTFSRVPNFSSPRSV
jgi:hypothetical protein